MYFCHKNPRPKSIVNISGYTIVELMVAMMIMIILFSLTYAGFRDFQRRQRMENAYQDIKADLRFAQELALANRKPTEPAGNSCITSGIRSYTFNRTSASTYNIIANCDADVIVKDNITLPTGITIDPFAGTNQIVFNILGRGNTSASIIIRWNGSGVGNKTITVSNSGTIE
jgi:Tfp pilus assembly protein FimT